MTPPASMVESLTLPKDELRILFVLEECSHEFLSPEAVVQQTGMKLDYVDDLIHDLRIDGLLGPMAGMSPDCRYLQLTAAGIQWLSELD